MRTTSVYKWTGDSSCSRTGGYGRAESGRVVECSCYTRVGHAKKFYIVLCMTHANASAKAEKILGAERRPKGRAVSM